MYISHDDSGYLRIPFGKFLVLKNLHLSAARAARAAQQQQKTTQQKKILCFK